TALRPGCRKASHRMSRVLVVRRMMDLDIGVNRVMQRAMEKQRARSVAHFEPCSRLLFLRWWRDRRRSHHCDALTSGEADFPTLVSEGDAQRIRRWSRCSPRAIDVCHSDLRMNRIVGRCLTFFRIL